MGYVLTSRALDISASEEELCFILGYLATPNRIKYIEAQVPYGKETKFENAYPGQNYDEMKITSDSFELLFDSYKSGSDKFDGNRFVTYYY